MMMRKASSSPTEGVSGARRFAEGRVLRVAESRLSGRRSLVDTRAILSQPGPSPVCISRTKDTEEPGGVDQLDQISPESEGVPGNDEGGGSGAQGLTVDLGPVGRAVVGEAEGAVLLEERGVDL